MDYALFYLTNCDTLFWKHFFWLFSPTLLNFNTWYGIYSCRPPTSSPNCHFVKLWNILCGVFEWQHFFLTHFLWNLAKVLDSGNNKRWKIFFFFEGHFLYFSPLIWYNHFLFIFSLLHSQNSCSASSIWNTWSLPLAPLFYFDKTHFYSMF